MCLLTDFINNYIFRSPCPPIHVSVRHESELEEDEHKTGKEEIVGATTFSLMHCERETDTNFRVSFAFAKFVSIFVCFCDRFVRGQIFYFD